MINTKLTPDNLTSREKGCWDVLKDDTPMVAKLLRTISELRGDRLNLKRILAKAADGCNRFDSRYSMFDCSSCLRTAMHWPEVQHLPTCWFPEASKLLNTEEKG